MIKAEPITFKYENKLGKESTILIKPNPIKHSSKVNPIVAPETKEKVLLNPLLIPDDIIIIFTGPGLIDITNENTAIEKIKDIITPYIVEYSYSYISRRRRF